MELESNRVLRDFSLLLGNNYVIQKICGLAEPTPHPFKIELSSQLEVAHVTASAIVCIGYVVEVFDCINFLEFSF